MNIHHMVISGLQASRCGPTGETRDGFLDVGGGSSGARLELEVAREDRGVLAGPEKERGWLGEARGCKINTKNHCVFLIIICFKM